MSEPVLPGDATARSTAEALDAADSLAHFRDQFYIDDEDVWLQRSAKGHGIGSGRTFTDDGDVPRTLEEIP